VFRFQGAVQYADGREETFECGNVALAAWERYAIRHKLPMGEGAPPTLSSLVVAHHALAIELALDPWIETVEGVELKAKDGEGNDVEASPTLAAPSTG
jgi:hypothetical protein